MEPLTQLEWTTKIFLAVLIPVLQGENACAGHTVDISTGEFPERDGDTGVAVTSSCRTGCGVING